MPVYSYKHPETGEIFEDLRKVKDRNKPYILKDGTKCKKIEFFEEDKAPWGWRSGREVYEVDSAWCKKCRPKYILKNNGERVRYDPTKHF